MKIGVYMAQSAIMGIIAQAILSQVFRRIAIATAGAIGAYSMIDVTHIGIPQEYQVPVIIAAIIAVVLIGFLTREYVHDKAADAKVKAGKIKTTNDLPYDKRYDAMTILGAIVGGFIGVFAAGVFISSYVVGAEKWTYVFFTVLFVGIGAYLAIMLFHLGIRLFWVRAKDYAALVKAEGDAVWGSLSDQEKANVLAILKKR